MLGDALAVVLFVGGVATIIGAWLSKREKRDLNQRVLRLADALESAQGLRLVQLPLKAVSEFYDLLFGPRYFSRKAIRREAALSVIVLLSGLVIAWSVTAVPLGIGTLPWNAFDRHIETLQEFRERRVQFRQKTAEEAKSGAEVSEEAQREVDRFVDRIDDFVLRHSGTLGRVTYSVIAVGGVLFVNCLFDILSFAVTRKMLRDMVTAPHPSILIGSLAMDAGLAGMIVFITLIAILILSYPPFWSTMALFLALSYHVPILGALVYLGLAVATWFLFGPWVKVVALTALLPTVILLMVIAAGLISHVMSGRVRHGVTLLLRRAGRAEKGPLGMIAGGATGIGLIYAALNHWILK
jgi:hypothetical protein